MKVLSKRKKHNGFIYLQIHRTKDVAIYLQYVGEKVAGFEVFEIVRKKETRFKDVIIPPREKFPSNSDFGKTAYAVPTLARALKRAIQIQKRILRRNGSNAPNYFESLLNAV